jgi:uncharacterized membrane protein YoaK (UPF0700 family)
MRVTLPVVLSLNGGYVDTAGFLALQGLFTAHVTGNFVTLGAALVLGTSGVLAKLLALPIFCIVVMAVRLLGARLGLEASARLRIFLALEVALLALGAILALAFGPFSNGDSWQAALTGMVLVSAMAIQNAVHRVHLSTAPPTTLMTGNTTQIMLDLAGLIGRPPAEQEAVVRRRLARMAASVLGFALGCGAAALLFALVHMACFILPPLVGAAALLLSATAEAPAKTAAP